MSPVRGRWQRRECRNGSVGLDPLPSALLSPTISRMSTEHGDVTMELSRMQDRLRALRWRLCESATNQNPRYHAFSGAIAQLNRVIADLERESAREDEQ